MIINLYEASTAINLAPVAFTPPVPPSCDSKPLKISFAVDDYEQTTYNYVWDSTKEKWFVRSNKLGGFEQYGLYASSIEPYEVVTTGQVETIMTDIAQYNWSEIDSDREGMHKYVNSTEGSNYAISAFKVVIPTGMSTYTLYIKSNNSSSSGYAMVSKLDATTVPSVYTSTDVYVHTRSTTTEKEVTFTIDDTTTVEHYFYVCYRKYSTYTAYAWLPNVKEITEVGTSVYEGKLAIIDGYEYEYQKDKWVNIGAIDIDTPPDNAIIYPKHYIDKGTVDTNMAVVDVYCDLYNATENNYIGKEALVTSDGDVYKVGDDKYWQYQYNVQYTIPYTTSNGAITNNVVTTGWGADLVANIIYNNKPTLVFNNAPTAVPSRAFYNDIGQNPITSIDLPNTITTINSYAFYNCQMPSITIPNSVTHIYNYVYYHNRALTSVTFEDNATLVQLGDGVFRSCEKLEHITLPNSLKYIMDYQFESCYKLKDIIIPNSVTSLRDYTVQNCWALTSVTIGGQIERCYGDVYKDTRVLKSIVYNDLSKCELGYQFSDYQGYLTELETLILTNNRYGFNISKSTKMTEQAFVNLFNSLGNAYNSSQTINVGAENIEKLSDATIAIAVSKGYILVGVTDAKMTYTTANNQAVLLSSKWGNARVIANTYSNNVGTIVFDRYPTAIPANEFADSQLATIDFADTITTIGDDAFKGSQLTTINLNKITTLGSGALQGTHITDLTINTNIPQNLCLDCFSLTSLTIGNNVTSIADDAFAGCGLLNTIFAKGKTAPTVATVAFDVAEVGTLHCISGYTDVYTDWIGNYLPIGWTIVDDIPLLPDAPMVFNYNAKNFNMTTLTIPNDSNAITTNDAVFNGVYEQGSDYIYLKYNRGQYTGPQFTHLTWPTTPYTEDSYTLIFKLRPIPNPSNVNDGYYRNFWCFNTQNQQYIATRYFTIDQCGIYNEKFISDTASAIVPQGFVNGEDWTFAVTYDYPNKVYHLYNLDNDYDYVRTAVNNTATKTEMYIGALQQFNNFSWNGLLYWAYSSNQALTLDECKMVADYNNY